MRESIGGAWIYGLALTFVLLFSCFLAIAINYSKVFRIKNEVVSIIENYSGFTDDVIAYNCKNGNDCEHREEKTGGGSLEIIANYLSASKYSTKGNCPSVKTGENNWYGYNDGTITDETNNVLFCTRRKEIKKNVYSYEIVLFFDANLPIIGDIFKFKINGETNDIFYPADKNLWDDLKK